MSTSCSIRGPLVSGGAPPLCGMVSCLALTIAIHEPGAAYWKTADVPNYVQLLSGIHDTQNQNAAGLTFAPEFRQCIIFWEWLWLGTMTPISEHCRSEHTVHELGHVFGMSDRISGTGHPLHHDWPSTPDDMCVMLYAADGHNWENSIAHFGGPTSPGTEPDDLKTYVAAHTDPL